MKYFILIFLISCAVTQPNSINSKKHSDKINQESEAMIYLLDSIDNYPTLFAATINTPDTSIHLLKPMAHRFEGFKRNGTDSLGRQKIELFNRLYRCKYSYVVNDQWVGEDFDVTKIDSSKVTGITILTDRAGVWVSHYGCEYLIIITTK